MKNEQLEGTKAYRAFREDHRRYGWAPDRFNRAPSRWRDHYRLYPDWGVMHYAFGEAHAIVVQPSSSLPVRFYDDIPIRPACAVGGLFGVLMAVLSVVTPSSNGTPPRDPVEAAIGAVCLAVIMGGFYAIFGSAIGIFTSVSHEVFWARHRRRSVYNAQHVQLLKDIDDALSRADESHREIRSVMWEAAASPERATLIRDMLLNRAPDTLSAVAIHPDGTIQTHHWALDPKNFPEDVYDVLGGQFDEVQMGASLVAWAPRSAASDNPGAERLGRSHNAAQKLQGTVLITGTTDSRTLNVEQALDIAGVAADPSTLIERRPRRLSGLPGPHDKTLILGND